MTKFAGMTRVRRALAVAVLAVIPATVIAAGYFVVSSPAASAAPAPAITRHLSPPNSGLEFTFTDASWPNVTFTCWLDSGPHRNCTAGAGSTRRPAIQGGWRFSQLTPGRHCLFVQVAQHGGRRSAATRFCWTVPVPQNFSVGSGLPSPLYPGTSQPLNVTFTNPNPVPITIASGGISARNITISPSTPGCASSNFAVTQGLIGAVTIPPGQTKPTSLSALGVPRAHWPVIKMLDTSTNQDACQDAKLTLTYKGIEATG
jgi:hypothetical protein